MSMRARRIADGLFAIQMGCVLLFGVTQISLMWKTTEGVSLTWFVFWAIFLGINLVLAVRAHQVQPSRVTSQTVFTYAAWLTVLAAGLGVLVWRSLGAWYLVDTVNVIVSGLGIAVTYLLGRRHGLGFADPMVRGWLAVFFKATPQLTLAWHITQVGGAGLAPIAIFSGHATICIRIGQLYFSIREAGWDRNRIGSAISEIANEVSWIITTAVWLVT
ncbi:MAG: hypothetical protein EXR86_11435 [Gammaproteobacteria bacterium]|nr:hypothetical protein [Gammaproteobacteria bacterium]